MGAARRVAGEVEAREVAPVADAEREQHAHVPQLVGQLGGGPAPPGRRVTT